MNKLGIVLAALVGVVGGVLADPPQIDNFNLPDGTLPPGWTVSSGQWSVKDHQFDGFAPGAAVGGSTVARVDKPAINFANGTILFKFKRGPNDGGLTSNSFLFRVQDNQNHYAFSWVFGGPSPAFQLRKVVNGSNTILASANTSNSFSDWQVVKIEASPTQVRVFVNDVLTFDVSDTNTFQGRIAIGIGTEEAPGNWRFDHIAVR